MMSTYYRYSVSGDGVFDTMKYSMLRFGEYEPVCATCLSRYTDSYGPRLCFACHGYVHAYTTSSPDTSCSQWYSNKGYVCTACARGGEL